MKQNLVRKILGKIKIFVQDFVTIKTDVRANILRAVPMTTLLDRTADFFKNILALQ